MNIVKEWDYQKAKVKVLVLVRFGDFFEAMCDDAKTIGEELDLIVSVRPVTERESVAMVGIPVTAIEGYKEKLERRGFIVVLRQARTADDILFDCAGCGVKRSKAQIASMKKNIKENGRLVI